MENFEEKLLAEGLRVPPEELAKLAAAVAQIEQAAALLRGERPYAEEPLSAFRLAPG